MVAGQAEERHDAKPLYFVYIIKISLPQHAFVQIKSTERCFSPLSNAKYVVLGSTPPRYAKFSTFQLDEIFNLFMDAV